MLPPARIHGLARDSRKIADKIAGQVADKLRLREARFYFLKRTGAPGAIPTRDLPLRRRTLYAAELREHKPVTVRNNRQRVKQPRKMVGVPNWAEPSDSVGFFSCYFVWTALDVPKIDSRRDN